MILASGAFDGLHAGHLAYLEAAKRYATLPGEELWVSVAPDVYIEQAKHRPVYWPQADRCRTIAGLRVVDRVISQREASMAETILRLEPRIVVKGIDWQETLPEDVKAACKAVEATVVFTATDGRHVRQAR